MKSGYYNIKDPIYGYIDVPADYMVKIVDTAEFQRLRRIIYSGYSSLYPAAVHNRFGHSLGVFWLGYMASERLTAEVLRKFGKVMGMDKTDKEFWRRMRRIFNLACLLHDIGHAPFSSAGEEFFLTDGKYTALHEELVSLVGTGGFGDDIPEESEKAAKPHEIMSAIVGIDRFSNFFKQDYEKEFFARCITGYTYSQTNFEKQILNCYISLLNGNVINVNQLDYLIRDAYVIGFSSANVDYEMLLSQLTIVEIEGNYELAYYKNAISVLENVVYAHDAEEKWLQSDPIVLYETYLLKHIIGNLCQELDWRGKKLFSHQSLTKEGHVLKGNNPICLMSDDDIVYLMKNIYPDRYSEEYLDRVHRYRPIWKNEVEYRAMFEDGQAESGPFHALENALKEMILYMKESESDGKLGRELKEKLEEDIYAIENSKARKDEKKKSLGNKPDLLKMITCIVEYKEKNRMDDDFILLTASKFFSGFRRNTFSEINISYPTGGGEERISKLGDILSYLKVEERSGEDFFYLFYKIREDSTGRKKTLTELNHEISEALLEAFGKEPEDKSVEKNDTELRSNSSGIIYRRI